MEYRNTKTGAVIVSNSEISGGDWIPVAAESSKKKSAPRKKKVQNNG